MRYAKGDRAFGFCDRTGFRYPISELVYEYKDGKRTGMRVGRDMEDDVQPQERIGKTKVYEAISLKDPRPDTSVDSLFGFDPLLGAELTMEGATAYVD